MLKNLLSIALILSTLCFIGCEDTTGAGVDDLENGDANANVGAVDAGQALDAGTDAATSEPPDASITDATSNDGDGGSNDAGETGDSGNDEDAGGVTDVGSTADVGNLDSGMFDAGIADTGSPVEDAGTGTDAGTLPDMSVGPGAGDCISGATGTHAVRFHWEGNGPNSRAYVRYDRNELPDTSRWSVGAYSRNFNYSPVFDDTFLGIGGLVLSGTVFMDVELSTIGLSSIRNVTLAIFGRSYNTTASGSFSWRSFDGDGFAPSGLVSNSAPYQWYGADATTAFAPGNGGVLLRISPDGPSNSLVVNAVELCFDAN